MILNVSRTPLVTSVFQHCFVAVAFLSVIRTFNFTRSLSYLIGATSQSVTLDHPIDNAINHTHSICKSEVNSFKSVSGSATGLTISQLCCWVLHGTKVWSPEFEVWSLSVPFEVITWVLKLLPERPHARSCRVANWHKLEIIGILNLQPYTFLAMFFIQIATNSDFASSYICQLFVDY